MEGKESRQVGGWTWTGSTPDTVRTANAGAAAARSDTAMSTWSSSRTTSVAVRGPDRRDPSAADRGEPIGGVASPADPLSRR
jgi:hypothetical protein